MTAKLYGVLLVLIVVVGLAGRDAWAQPCGVGVMAPQCDGQCPLGQMCADSGGSCICVPTVAACGDPVETPVDHPLDALADRVDRLRRERLAHEPTQPRVRRRVALEHELALALQRLVDPGEEAVRGAHAGGHLVQQAVHVRVAGEPPEAERRHVHRVRLAQPAEPRVRIVAELGIERIATPPRVVGWDGRHGAAS